MFAHSGFPTRNCKLANGPLGRIVAFMLVALLSCTLLACTDTSADETDTTASTVSTEESSETESSEAEIPTTETSTTDDSTTETSTTDDSDSSYPNKFWDRQTGQWILFDDISHIHELCNVKEYDYYNINNNDWPTGISAELTSGRSLPKGEITDSDVINDLWYRVVQMRLLIHEPQDDNDTSEGQRITFYWDDGRTQTYTIKGSGIKWYFAHKGTLYPIFEHEYTDGEDFSTPVVQRVPNSFFPGAVLDAISMLADDVQGKAPVIVVTHGSTTVQYEKDSFGWDADDNNTRETYKVTYVKANGDTPGGIRLEGGAYDTNYSCLIEGGTKLCKIDIISENGTRTAHATYEAGNPDEVRECDITYADGNLVVNYL